ncbi:MAG: ABC transporter ATP-binding protein/permease [Clostridia bacterium]|nr:ABC transporter ATP-binding protein/permease [Clostridia bacterium]
MYKENSQNSLFNLLKKYRLSYLFVTMVYSMHLIFAYYIPVFLGEITDALANNKLSLIYEKLDLLFLVLIVSIILKLVYAKNIYRLAYKIYIKLKIDIMDHLLKTNIYYYESTTSGDFLYNVSNNLETIPSILSHGFTELIRPILTLGIGIVVASFYINYKLLIISLIPAPLFIVLMMKSRKAFLDLNIDINNKNIELSSKTNEMLKSFRIIKAYQNYYDNLLQIKKILKDINQKVVESDKNINKLSIYSKLLYSTCIIVSLLVSVYLINKGEITVGQFISFNALITSFLIPLFYFSNLLIKVNRWKIANKTLSQIYSLKTFNDNGTKSFPYKFDIEIENLNFSYKNAETRIFKNFNMKIKQGDFIVITGVNKSGKSTLAKLLVNFYNSNESIKIGGINIEKIKKNELYKNIGYVMQDDYLFMESIKNNFLSTHEYVPTVNDIKNASVISCIYDDISKFDKGIDTMIGEGGIRLSGGQRARLNIAKNIVKKSKILILDDVYSAIDSKKSKIIIDNIRLYLKESTIVLFTNDNEILKTCNNIFFIDDGVIKGKGSYNELSNNSEFIRKIVGDKHD